MILLRLDIIWSSYFGKCGLRASSTYTCTSRREEQLFQRSCPKDTEDAFEEPWKYAMLGMLVGLWYIVWHRRPNLTSGHDFEFRESSTLRSDGVVGAENKKNTPQM
ncbi:unnamed protein product [Protopolystoma xenopodis]|uniref:Uncharacterized protein n=1 Tax=Protopolystoma xenopodis TaxID=117903 RepID=A0A448WZT5_9PLAT|nr:unnamed protein product [Protopolystoma xenopodis]